MRIYERPWFFAALMVTGLVTAALISSALEPDQPAQTEPSETDLLMAQINEQVRIERLVKRRLRDPESAIFNHLGKGCGYVNASNGFGGMAGNIEFIVGANDKAVFRQDDPQAFNVLWQGHCLDQGSGVRRASK